MSDPFNQQNTGGYPQQQPVGYDPQTGAPIYAQPQTQASQPVGYDPQTGAPIYAQPQTQAPQPVGYDPQTGAPVYEQAPQQPYAPYYAQPQSSAPAETKAPKKKKTGLIAGISAAVVVALAAIAIFVWPKPFSKNGSSSGARGPVETAINNTGNAYFSQSELGGFLVGSQQKKSGNLGIDLRVTDIGSLISSFNDQMGYGQIGGSAGAGLVVAGDGSEMSLTMDVSVMGLSYSAQLYASKQGLQIAIPELFTGTYLIPFENAEQELAASVFNPNSGSTYALDDYSYNQLLTVVQQISALKDAAGSADAPFSDLEEKLEAAGLKKEFTTEQGSVTVDGESLSCTVATMQFTNDELIRYVEFMRDYLQDYFAELQQSAPALNLSLDLDDLDDLANTLRRNGAEAKIELDIYNNYVVRMDLQAYDPTHPTENSYHIIGEFGKDPKSSNHFSIYLTEGTYEGERLDFNVTENSSSAYAFTADISSQGTLYYTVSFNWNKSSGDFTLRYIDKDYYYDEDSTYTLTGNAKVEGSKLTILMDAFSFDRDGGYYSRTLDLSSIQIVLDRDAKIVKPSGSAKDILTMTESEISSLINEVQSNLGALQYLFG